MCGDYVFLSNVRKWITQDVIFIFLLGVALSFMSRFYHVSDPFEVDEIGRLELTTTCTPMRAKRSKPLNSRSAHGGAEVGSEHLSKQTLSRARSGSLFDITLISQTLIQSKQCITAQVLDSLLCHFQSSKIPKSVDAITSRNNQNVENCIAAHVGISVLYVHQDAIAAKDVRMLLKTSWPDVFCWMQYFYVACVDKRLGTPDQNQMMLDNLIGMLATFLTSQGKDGPSFVSGTPGTVRMATQLWIQKGIVQDKTFFPDSVITPKEASFVLFEILGAEEDTTEKEAVEEVVKGAESCGDGLSIVEILQTRLKFALRGGQEFAKTSKCLLHALSRLSSPTHSLQQEFLTKGTVSLVLNCLSELIAKSTFKEYGDPESVFADNVVMCFHYVCSAFYRKPGVQWVLQALNSGLFEVFVACGPMYPFFQDRHRDHIISVLSSSFMPYLIFLPVISASAKVMDGEKTRSLTELLSSSTEAAKSAWLTLMVVIAKRMQIANEILGEYSRNFSCACDNCYKLDEVSSFKKCAGCGIVYYCSKRCQVQAWKERGHREECKLYKEKGITPHSTDRTQSLVDSKKREDAFIRDVARIEAHEKLETLRRMAGDQHPDVEIEDLGVSADYCVFPPVFGVFVRRECVLARKAEQVGATSSWKNEEFKSGTREHLGEKIRRTNKDLTHLEVKVTRGDDYVFLHFSVYKFWEGLSCEDANFEIHVALRDAEEYLRVPLPVTD